MSTSPLHHQALERLGQDIVAGRYPAGSVLTLAGLEESFVISRTVAREIMRVLEGLGVVHSRRRVGITVQPRAQWHLLDPRVMSWRLSGPERAQAMLEVVELRVALQPLAAMLAARYATKAQRDRLLELADKLSNLSLVESAEAAQVDLEFHALVLRSGRNELFASVAALIRLVQRPGEVARSMADPRWAIRYRGIAVAIASGEEDLARRWAAEQVRLLLASVTRQADVVRPAQEERPGVEGWSV